MKIIATEKVILGVNPDDFKPYLVEQAKKEWEFY